VAYTVGVGLLLGPTFTVFTFFKCRKRDFTFFLHCFICFFLEQWSKLARRVLRQRPGVTYRTYITRDVVQCIQEVWVKPTAGTYLTSGRRECWRLNVDTDYNRRRFMLTKRRPVGRLFSSERFLVSLMTAAQPEHRLKHESHVLVDDHADVPRGEFQYCAAVGTCYVAWNVTIGRSVWWCGIIIFSQGSYPTIGFCIRRQISYLTHIDPCSVFILFFFCRPISSTIFIINKLRHITKSETRILAYNEVSRDLPMRI